jgi:hypothetical protein
VLNWVLTGVKSGTSVSAICWISMPVVRSHGGTAPSFGSRLSDQRTRYEGAASTFVQRILEAVGPKIVTEFTRSEVLLTARVAPT